MKKWLFTGLLILVLTALAACGGKDKAGEANEDLLSDGKLTIGVTAGPHEEIVEKVKELAEKEGLEIDLQVFSDYVMPNVALAEKEIDMNIFQTIPFFEQMKKDRNLDLVAVGETVTFPMGIYSNEIKDVSDLADGAKIGLPNDPTQGGRALLLFESAGMITLKDGVDSSATVNDILDNPKEFQFVELDAAQIPRQLNELDAAAINTNFVIDAGLSPAEDSIFIEPKDSPFVNIVAVRAESKDEEVVQQFVDLYRSEEVKQFIEERFDGSLIPSW